MKNQRAKKAVRPMATECLSESVPMCENRYYREEGIKGGGRKGAGKEERVCKTFKD